MAVTNPAKDLRALERRLRPQGWTVAIDGRGHPTFTSPDGVKVRTSATSHGGRGWENFVAALRRAGADLTTDAPPIRAQRRSERPEVVKVAPARPRAAERTTEPVAAPPVVVIGHDEHERTVEDVPLHMVTCRVLRHAWEPIGRGRSLYGVAIVMGCSRCGATRRDLVRSWDGTVLSRGYRYSDEYSASAPTARPTMAEWRQRWVGGLQDLPELDVDMNPRRMRSAS